MQQPMNEETKIQLEQVRPVIRDLICDEVSMACKEAAARVKLPLTEPQFWDSAWEIFAKMGVADPAAKADAALEARRATFSVKVSNEA